MVLHLTDGEMAELLEDLQSVVLPRLANQPGNDRTKRLLTTIVVPSDD